MTDRRVRMTPEERYALTLDAAVRVAQEFGLSGWNRAVLAQEAGCSEGLINHVLGGREEIQAAVLQAAVERKILPLLAQGIGLGRLSMRDLPRTLRTEVADYLASQ